MPGAIGSLLLLAGAWIWLIDVPTADKELRDLERLGKERVSVVERGRSSEIRPAALASSMPLPDGATNSALPAAVALQLRSAGVLVSELVVRESQLAGTSVRSLDITVTGRGTYRNLKHALSELTQRHPSLALDHLTMSATDGATTREPVLDARMSLRYFFVAG